MINRFHKTKLTGISVLAFLLVAVMLVGMIPSMPLEVHAATVRASGEAFTGDYTLELWDSQDSSKHETHKMTHDGNKWNTLKSSVLPANFLAYTGTAGSVTARSATDYTVTPVEDQSTEAKYKAADVMIATGTVSKDEPLNLNFEHCFAQVRFLLQYAAEFDSDEPIKNFYVGTGNADVPEIKPYVNRGFYSAYIPAGKYPNDSALIRIEIGEYTGENALVVKFPQDITLDAGMEYDFLIKVGKDLVEITKIGNDSLGSGWTKEAYVEFPNHLVSAPYTGKTSTVDGDKILVSMTFNDDSKDGAALERKNGTWELNGRILYKSDPMNIESVYAPDCEIKSDGSIGYKDGKLPGMNEYIKVNNQHKSGTSYSVNFNNVTRDYSRLRIMGLPGTKYTVMVTDFTGAGETERTASRTYSLTADEKGNAYLYGTFAKDGTVIVKQNAVTVFEITFSEERGYINGTEPGMSYKLDGRAIVDGTLRGEHHVTAEDVAALLERFKTFVDNGVTTIVVPGDIHPTYTKNGITKPAYAWALDDLTGINENSPYCGKIDLVLPDQPEIIDETFSDAYALNSITLPRVTQLGKKSFINTPYLQTITFGSVVTNIANQEVFEQVGDMVGGCNLVLNCGQVNDPQYKPEQSQNSWCNTSWKSITLTHTGGCDECKN